MSQFLIPIMIKEYLPLFQTLLGGLLTFLGGLTASVLLQSRQIKAERKSLASAFLGEIKALNKIFERRRYAKVIKVTIYLLERSEEASPTFRITREYSKVYNENIDKIGCLPAPLPELIVDFYMSLTSMYEDMDIVNEEGFYRNKKEECIRILEEILYSLEYLSESAHIICKKLLEVN